MKDITDQFNLPKYTKGKSFADASSMIMDKFRERKDPESKRTMTELLDRLRQAQEFVKEQNKTPEEREQEQMQMQEQQMQQEQSQDVNPQMEEQMMQEQPQQQIQQTQFANGGLMDYISKNNSRNNFANGGFIDDKTQSDEQMNQAIGGAQDAVASTFGPIGGVVRGVQKLGGAIGDTIGGDAGALIGGMFNPIEGTMSVLSNKDASTGQKILGSIPGLGGIVSKKLADKRELEQERNQTQLGRNQALNTFANGGQMTNQYFNGGEPDPKLYDGITNPDASKRLAKFDRLNNIKPGATILDRQKVYNAKFAGDPNNALFDEQYGKGTGQLVLDNKYGDNTQAAFGRQKAMFSDLKTRPGININQNLTNTITPVTPIGKSLPEKINKINDKKNGINWSGLNASALRYAPTAVNAFQLATLPKAEVESLNRLDNRYKPGYVDESALQNIAKENYNMTSQALTGASGGSTSALRSNILGAGLNRNKALSSAYLKADDINRGEDTKAQQFNLGVDRVNLQQSNSEKDINARNRAARDNAKSKLLSGIGTDLGNIGKEEKYKDIIEKVSGYDQDGELAAAKKAKKEKVKKDNILKRKSKQIKRTAKKSPINAIQRNDFNLYNGLKTYNV